MPFTYLGPLCARRGCVRPEHEDGLCARCRRLARFFGKPPELLAYEPVYGYKDDRDAVELPWERWEQEGDLGVAALFAAPPPADRPAPQRRPR
ncbi:MAG: hypothetical protein ACR2J6_01155 [Thermoleophilaceae bacterium]